MSASHFLDHMETKTPLIGSRIMSAMRPFYMIQKLEVAAHTARDSLGA
jgi:hypothetical protein